MLCYQTNALVIQKFIVAEKVSQKSNSSILIVKSYSHFNVEKPAANSKQT